MKLRSELACCAASVLLVVVLTAALAAGARYGLLENGMLPRDCSAPDAAALPCALKTVLMQLFIDQRIGWFSFACAALAFVLSHRGLAWLGCVCGVAGLVLYSQDPAAVGALLAVLVLLGPNQQRRKRKREAGQQPGDRLGIGGLA